jgi:hypothetical protein
MLGMTLLEELRAHWRWLRTKPRICPFPGGRYHGLSQNIRDKGVLIAVKDAAGRAGMKKEHSPSHGTPVCRNGAQPSLFCDGSA